MQKVPRGKMMATANQKLQEYAVKQNPKALENLGTKQTHAGHAGPRRVDHDRMA